MFDKFDDLVLVDEDRPWLHFKGGGGGGGGSGKVDYPDYMETIHSTWLSDVDSLMDTARAANPLTGDTVYDPDNDISNIWTQVCAFNVVVDALSNNTDYCAAMVAVTDCFDTMAGSVSLSTPTPAAAGELSDSVDAFETVHDDHITSDVLPRFRAGMRSINAVQSSAFVIGQGVIEDHGDNIVSDYQGKLRIQAYLQSDKILADNIDNKNKLNTQIELTRQQLIVQGVSKSIDALLARVNFEKDVTHYTTEAMRLKIIAKVEEDGNQREIDKEDALWDLDTTHYGAEMLASIGGGVAGTARGPSQGKSALAGALGGAAAGASFGPWGAAAGAGLGLLGSFL